MEREWSPDEESDQRAWLWLVIYKMWNVVLLHVLHLMNVAHVFQVKFQTLTMKSP